MIRNQLRGTKFAIRQFGVLMDIAAPRHNLSFNALHSLIDFVREERRLRKGQQKQQMFHGEF